MRILQIIPSRISSQDTWNKWYCSDSVDGLDGDPVIRYLQSDGTWGKTTHYFDSDWEIHQLLELGHKPDFTLSRRDLEDRAMIRQDIEDGFRELEYPEDQPQDWPD